MHFVLQTKAPLTKSTICYKPETSEPEFQENQNLFRKIEWGEMISYSL